MRKRYVYGLLEGIGGVVFLVLAFVIFSRPDMVLATLVYLTGFLAIAGGIIDVANVFTADRGGEPFKTTSFLAGLLGVAVGIVLLTNQTAGGWIITLLFPVWLVGLGFGRLLRLRSMRVMGDRWPARISGLTGILGIALGLLLIWNPAVSVLSMTYIIGVYALFAGLEMLFLAARVIRSAAQ